MGRMTMKFKGGGNNFTVEAPSEAVAEIAIPNAEVVQEEDNTPNVVEVQVVEIEKIVEVIKEIEVIKEVEKVVYVPEYIDKLVEVEKIVEVEKVVEKNVYIPTFVNRDIVRSMVPPTIYVIMAGEAVAIVSLLCYILK